MTSGGIVANVYPIMVDYGLSVEDAVKIGRYDWANKSITSVNFKTTRNGVAEVKVELVHFDFFISTEDVLHEFYHMAMRPAELLELLAFGKKYPDIQRKLLIVALGSVWWHQYGASYVPRLSGNGSKRNLILDLSETGWAGIYWFAAVR